MQSLLIEAQYLPCIEYFATLDSIEDVFLECEEHYVKQTFRNRCRILTAQGPHQLSIPIEHSRGKIKMKDVKIDYRQKWVANHWRTISSAYGNAPFFEHFGHLFHGIYQQKTPYLLDLNLEFFSLCEKLLSLEISFKKTSAYCKTTGVGIMDWRSRIHPKKPLENNPFYKPCNYNQIFGKKFVGNLSIIDLLFCEGPEACHILKSSKR